MAIGSPSRALLCALTLGLPLVGCKASVQANVKSGANAEAEPDPFAHLNDPEPTPTPDPNAAQLAEVDAQLKGNKPALALLGARHDLQLRPRATPICSCMAFANGAPSDPRFAWEEQPPALAASTSTVVAFGMVEGECASEVVASYRGYEVVGADVHLLLEAAVDGRPQLSGAVVPAPQSGGHFVVVPPKDAPFGKSRVAGETQCVLPDDSTGKPATGKPANGAANGVKSAAPGGQPSEHKSGLQHAARAPGPSDDDDVPTSEEFASTPSDIPLDDGERSHRDSFHLGLALGLEYPIARISVGNGLEPAPLSGLGGGFDLFIGGNQKPGMAVGLTIGGASAPNPSFDFDASQGGDAQTTGEQSGWDVSGSSLVLNGARLNLFRVGAFVDYYFSDDTNWHGLLTLGYARMSFSGLDVPDTPEGFAMQAGLGYDFWLSYHWSLGVLGRLMWSPMKAESLDDLVHVWSPNLGVTAAFH